MTTPAPKPDMAKVKAAVARLGSKTASPKQHHEPQDPADAALRKPLKAHEPQDPVDSALRKPLKAHGSVCCGFQHPHFLNGLTNQ